MGLWLAGRPGNRGAGTVGVLAVAAPWPAAAGAAGPRSRARSRRSTVSGTADRGPAHRALPDGILRHRCRRLHPAHVCLVGARLHRRPLPGSPRTTRRAHPRTRRLPGALHPDPHRSETRATLNQRPVLPLLACGQYGHASGVVGARSNVHANGALVPAGDHGRRSRMTSVPVSAGACGSRLIRSTSTKPALVATAADAALAASWRMTTR